MSHPTPTNIPPPQPSQTSLPTSSTYATELAPSPNHNHSPTSSSSSLDLLADTAADNDSSASNSMANNRTPLRDFLASIATMRGDLSNITAPPFVLSTLSTVELPQFWAGRPDVFVAPALVVGVGRSAAAGGGVKEVVKDEDDLAARRMLAVLRWWVSSLRGQQYAGRDPSAGVKKPLNAVLGEVFVASWSGDTAMRPGGGDGGSSRASVEVDGDAFAVDGGDIGTTIMVSEQVSHHPPVTACRVWNDTVGVEAEGFTRQEITLSGSGVLIRQLGYALYKVRSAGETYLIPLPDVKIKGILSGIPYPELSGKYVLVCTSGWAARVEFSGKGGFLGFGGSGERHGVRAEVYRDGEGTGAFGEEGVRYKLDGHWDRDFTITDGRTGDVLETFDVAARPLRKAQTVNVDEMDPYETGRVWRGVRDALATGDMQGVSDAKNRVEQGQREMRKVEESQGKKWESIFFKDTGRDDVGGQLVSKAGQKWESAQTMGLWKFDENAWQQRKRPFHGGSRPDNTIEGSSPRNSMAADVTPNGHGTVGAANVDATLSMDKTTAEQNGVRDSVTSAAPREKVHPPLPAEQQQKEAQETRLANGVGGMSLEEQTAVEEMLRKKYASGPASKRDKMKM